MIGQRPNEMRTAARRVRGLGAARSGTGDFWHQRVTAVAGLFWMALMFSLTFSDYLTRN